MVLVIEPNLRLVRIWAFQEIGGKIKTKFYNKDMADMKTKESVRRNIDNIVGENKLEAISFRLFFGGDFFDESTIVDDHFISKFRKLVGYMPLYISSAEKVLKSFYGAYEQVPLVGFFETAFFSKLPLEEKCYALPYQYYQKNQAKKFGFHGIAHQFNGQLSSGSSKMISIVLDRQTTVCPIFENKPFSISLGVTPLEGIMGQKSSGDLDPGIVFYLMKRYHYSIFKIDEILKKESGFLGLTGYDLEMEELYKLYGKDDRVNFAFDVYQNQIIKYIGEGISSLGGLDAIVFSGVNLSFLIPFVHRLIRKIAFLGINLKSLPWDTNKDVLDITSHQSNLNIKLSFKPTSEIIFYQTKRHKKLKCSS